MPKSTNAWKKGRGTLGLLDPLLGRWEATVESPMGPMRCTRTFRRILGDTAVALEAEWRGVASDFRYDEHAIYHGEKGGTVRFWSFTSDGKRSEGVSADGGDAHPEAIAFEAEMPAGRARFLCWPDADEGWRFAVEALNRKGWKRFTEHHYRKA